MHRRVLVLVVCLTVLGLACSGAGSNRAPRAASSGSRQELGTEADGGATQGEGGDADRVVGPARIAAGAQLLDRAARTAPLSSAPAAGWQPEQVWNASHNDWEPTVATDPSSSWVYEATTRYGGPKACTSCPDPAIILRTSSDGGATWGPDGYLCACKNTKAQNDPVLAVSTSGVVYAVWMNDYNPGVVFSKSTNHGATWSAPIALKGKGLSFTDKPWLAISPDGRDVYVAFNSSDSYIVSSHDFGATFSARVKTNTDSLYWFAEGGAVAPGGAVYFAESAENQSATGPVKIAVLKSANGGASWSTTFVDTSQEQPSCTVASCGADFFAPSASLDVDSSGRLLLAYSANDVAQANKTMYVRTSTDGGATWSARTDIGQNAGDNGFPTVEAGPTAGDFRVAWQDDRNGTTGWNTWYRRTTDGGATWSAQVKLSDATSGAPYKTAAGYAFPYGDYLDLAVDASGQNLVIWGEGPNYVGPGGTWSTRGV